MKRIITFFLVVSLSTTIVHSGIFSQVNKFDLSYSFLKNRHRQFFDSTVFLYSIPDPSASTDKQPHLLHLKQNDQTLGLNIGGIGSGLHQNTKDHGFGMLFGSVQYRSSFLSADIDVSCYTTNRPSEDETCEIQTERFIYGLNVPITGVFDFRFNLPRACLQFFYKDFSLLMGKQKLRWGPGFKGTLGLSGTSFAPFYFYHLQQGFGKTIHLSAFLCGYDDEEIYASEIKMNDSMIVKANKIPLHKLPPRYGAGQRLDWIVSDHIQIGMYELVDFFGTQDFTRFANPLQIYYLGNEASGTNNANLLGGIDMNVVFKPFRFYAEFLNDDITYLENAGNPNKYALQFGAEYYLLNSFIQSIGVEYTHITKYTYGHCSVLSRHSIWGKSLGWQWGNYQDLFHSHALFEINQHCGGKVELNYWLKGDGKITDDWYTDGIPDLDKVPFLPRHPLHLITTTFAAYYKPVSWITLELFYNPYWKDKQFGNNVYAYLVLDVPAKFKKYRD